MFGVSRFLTFDTEYYHNKQHPPRYPRVDMTMEEETAQQLEQDHVDTEQDNNPDHALISDGTSNANEVDQQQEGGQNNGQQIVTSSTTRQPQHHQPQYDQQIMMPSPPQQHQQQQPIMQQNQMMTQHPPNINPSMVAAPLPLPSPGGASQQQHHPALAMAQYYEAQMRDHAAAYASAAAGAAWAAAQIACSATSNLPPALPQTTPFMYGPQHPSQPPPPPHSFSPTAGGPRPYPPLLSPPSEGMDISHQPNPPPVSSTMIQDKEKDMQTQPGNENDTSSNAEEKKSYNRPEKRHQRMMPEDEEHHQQEPTTSTRKTTRDTVNENVKTTSQQEATNTDNPQPPAPTRPTPMNPLSPAFQPPTLDGDGGVFYPPNPSMSPLSEGSAMNHNHLHQYSHAQSQPAFLPPSATVPPVPMQHQPSPFAPQPRHFFPPSAPTSDPNHHTHGNPPFYPQPPVADGLSPQFYPVTAPPQPVAAARMVDGVPPVPQQHHHHQLQQQHHQYSSGGNRPHNATQQQQQQQPQHGGNENINNATNVNSKRGRRRLRSSVDNYSSGGESSSMGGGGSGNNAQTANKPNSTSTKNSNYKKHKQKYPKTGCSDDSLVGKTGVSALHEWCAKRRMQPPSFFVEGYKEGQYPEFEISCRIQSQEWGCGRAGTKVAARQDAARRALQALVPGGVVFDNNGILTAMPLLGTGTNALSITTASAPPTAKAVNAETSLVDDILTPNLASRLAIGVPEGGCVEDEGGTNNNNSSATKRYRNRGTTAMTTQPKRRFNIYPGTSTTSASEDDDENTFYASRGASVCSSLLHAMCQIDARLPEPPVYEFDVVANSAENSKTQPDDAKIVSDSMKRSFSCIASLCIRPEKNGTDENTGSSTNGEVEAGTEQVEAKDEITATPPTPESQGEERVPKEEEDTKVVDTKNDNEDDVIDKSDLEKFEVIGTGASKREARHVASAKLLAMLFPECDGMAEVKAAAEAVREKYAASKALKQQQKQQSKRAAKFTDVRIRQRRRNFSSLPQKYNVSFALPASTDPPLPNFLSERLQTAICCKSPTVSEQSPQKRGVEGLNKIAALSISENTDSSTSKAETADGELSSSLRHTQNNEHIMDECIARQLSRRRQLEEKVDAALLVQSEIDDGGRYLKVELCEDDVGRIVLRRAGSEDLVWIQKLLSGHQQHRGKDLGPYNFGKHDSSNEISPLALLHDATSSQNDCSEGNHQLPCLLWGSGAVVMLLCRAVALRDEPPLGVAVLTLGFSMKQGRLLKISEMAHEQHVPEERFVESLEVLAKNMKCVLERKAPAQPSKKTRDTKVKENGTESKETMHLGSDDLKAILNSHIHGKTNNTTTGGVGGPVDAGSSLAPEEALRDDDYNSNVFFFGKSDSGAPLQSVKEEECEGDEEKHRDSDSGTDRRGSKGQDKTSKRARGQNKPSKRSRVS